jgi:hypothetical protein
MAPMLLIFVSPLIFGSIRPTQLQQSMKLVLGAAAESVACQASFILSTAFCAVSFTFLTT